MNDYLIIANGNFLIKEIIAEAAHDKIVIALDGAYHRLKRLGFVPHIALGDFDSLDLSTVLPETEIISTPDQQFNDLTKAIHYCDEQEAKSITIICAIGGRLDHHEGTIRTLRAQYRKERPLLLHTEEQSARFAKDEVVTMKGEIGDKCGILAFPAGSFSSSGLQYDVENYVLTFGYSENTCNALARPETCLTIQGEALIVMPPVLTSQRNFARKSEAERLELQLRDAKADQFLLQSAS